MEKGRCKIVFNGIIAEGYDVEKVKKNLAGLFKQDAAQIERLFTGEPVTLKSNLDQETVLKYTELLRQVGAICVVKPVSDSSYDHQEAEAQESSQEEARRREEVEVALRRIEEEAKARSEEERNIRIQNYRDLTIHPLNTWKKRRSKVINISIFAILLILCFIGLYVAIEHRQYQLELQRRLEEDRKLRYEYLTSVYTAKFIMSASVMNCTDMCSDYLDVLKSYNIRKHKIYNAKVLEVQSRLIEVGDIKEIDNDKSKIEAVLKSLSAFPPLYPELYDKLKELYDVYSQLHSLVTLPPDPLEDFTKTVKDLQTKFIRLEEQFDGMIPKDMNEP